MGAMNGLNLGVHSKRVGSTIRRVGSAYLLASAVLLVLLDCGAALGQTSSPEAAGLSSERLRTISTAFQAAVDNKEIPGAVLLIARQGKVGYFEAFGYRDREAEVPMTRDAIFRIASMTKPVTVIAAMTLVEQGRLNLSDPVSRYLPEFKELKVGVEKEDGTGKTVLVLEDPRREMTVLDLMRHTSGLTYGFTGKSLVRARYDQEKIDDPELNNEGFVSRLSRAPLQNQPGEVFDYSVSTDVLGRIVEVVAGLELEQYFVERIFVPLQMTDTGFRVSEPAKRWRIAEVQADAMTGKRPSMPDKTAQRRQSGGGALVSTASDYARFAQMLLNGGELDGARIVSRKTIEEMTQNQLPPGIKINNVSVPVLDLRPEAGNGFGLNLMVRTADGRGPIPGNVGDYTWPGIFGTYFWVDPKKELVVVMMMQVPASATALRNKFAIQTRELVYRILTD
jgi:CubicO group peptidase (beta-lactamase class C family)